MPTKPVFRRKQYLIKKGLQFKYIGLIFALAILASVVTGYTVFVTGWTLLGEKLANVYPQGRLMYVFKTTNLTLIRNLIFISPLIFVLGLLFSHRIAGPVYRIEKSIYEISKGNLAMKIKLRKGDELWDLADLINTMTENLSNTISLNKDTISKIQKDLGEIKAAISNQPCNSTAVQASINELEEKIKTLRSSFDSWTTTA